ncbi:hypothetical protein B0H15DRAFT_1017535 [Mycena belliarum]|uniref:Uncharacterized protein n=1 Tax=Mycena belliarum TaxID=1033014 RepID=A0AAD6XX45_9AGAR|nr:hypothetical protein B0H15DRAFT_1017535 [Mycena belliae]
MTLGLMLSLDAWRVLTPVDTRLPPALMRWHLDGVNANDPPADKSVDLLVISTTPPTVVVLILRC